MSLPESGNFSDSVYIPLSERRGRRPLHLPRWMTCRDDHRSSVPLILRTGNARPYRNRVIFLALFTSCFRGAGVVAPYKTFRKMVGRPFL